MGKLYRQLQYKIHIRDFLYRQLQYNSCYIPSRFNRPDDFPASAVSHPNVGGFSQAAPRPADSTSSRRSTWAEIGKLHFVLDGRIDAICDCSFVCVLAHLFFFRGRPARRSSTLRNSRESINVMRGLIRWPLMRPAANRFFTRDALTGGVMAAPNCEVVSSGID